MAAGSWENKAHTLQSEFIDSFIAECCCRGDLSSDHALQPTACSYLLCRKSSKAVLPPHVCWNVRLLLVSSWTLIMMMCLPTRPDCWETVKHPHFTQIANSCHAHYVNTSHDLRR